MSDVIQIAKSWAEHDPDSNTKNQILQLINENNLVELNKIKTIFRFLTQQQIPSLFIV